ncbi:MAG: LolA family protein [Deltaproteobacteria bacterium]
MKKSLTVLTSMLLIVTLFILAGCSKDKTNEPTSSNPARVTEKSDSSDAKELQKLFKSASGIKGVSYDMTTTINGPQGTMTTLSKCFMTDKKIRIELDANGMKSVILSNGAGDTYMYTPSANTAMKSSRPREKSANQWANSAEDLANFKIAGNEKMDGYDCVVVTTSTPEGDTKMWLREDIGMPVRVESGKDQDKMVIEYKNITMGVQNDSLFELPAGVRVIDMSQMQGGQMPQGGNMPKVPPLPPQGAR